MSTDSIPADWQQVSGDPDLTEDLGYYLLDLEIISTTTSDDQVIILPKEESLLKDDAFIIADAGDIAELAEWA